jgi:hypothetical protein
MQALPQPIERLLSHRRLWRAADLARVSQETVSSGFAALDAELPGGGWPVGALTELELAHEGIGELRMLGRALAALSRDSQRLAWIAPPHRPFAPALSAAGIDLANLVIVRTASQRDTLWASEQALASGACGAVLAWLPEAVNFTALRRLSLAAESGRALAFLFRAPRAACESTPAALRIAVETADGGLALRLLKRRGTPLAAPVLLPAFPTQFPEPHALDRRTPAQPAAGHIPAQLAAA